MIEAIPLTATKDIHPIARKIRLSEYDEVIGILVDIEYLDDEVILCLSRYEKEILILSFFDEDAEFVKKFGLDKAINQRIGILKIDREIRIKII